MSSIYYNPAVARAMSGQGAADRQIRTVRGPLEQTVTVTATTDPAGDVGWGLSIDLVDREGITLLARPIGAYHYGAQEQVRRDGLIVARILCLPLRIACLWGGWRVEYDPDGPAIVAPTGDPFKVQ